MSTEDHDTEPIKRPRLVLALIILASLLAVVSALHTWVERQLLDTDEWVTASRALLANDDVREELSAYLVDELYQSVDVEAEIEKELPEDVQFAAGPLSAALRRPATEAVDELLKTDTAQDVWRETNRAAHETLVDVLEGRGGDGVKIGEGTVVLDLGELVRSLGEDIGVPTAALDQIGDDAGTITVAESDELATAQDVVGISKILSFVLFVLVIAIYGLAVYLAGPGRRPATRNVGISVVVSGLAVVALRELGSSAVVDSLVDDPSQEAAATAVAEIATNLLSDIAWAGVTVGVLIVVFAGLAGPTAWAVQARRTVAPWFRDYPVGTWVAIAAVVMILVIWSPFTPFRNLLTGVLAVVLLGVGIEAIRRKALGELEAESGAATERLSAVASPGDDEGE